MIEFVLLSAASSLRLGMQALQRVGVWQVKHHQPGPVSRPVLKEVPPPQTASPATRYGISQGPASINGYGWGPLCLVDVLLTAVEHQHHASCGKGDASQHPFPVLVAAPPVL